MGNYSDLEQRFLKFRRGLVKYKQIYEPVRAGIADAEFIKEEEKLRSLLTQTYGELAGHIHGMAGYVEKIYLGVRADIFMLALTPNIYNVAEKSWGIDSSIQCLDKAIGGCRYARSVEVKKEQIVIHKGAVLDGWLIIIKMFQEAKKKIYIRDRYLNEEVFPIIEKLDSKIDVKAIIMKEKYKDKTNLELIYKKYQKMKNNVEIRELERNKFHRREIIIDEQKGYWFDFSIKDVGLNDGTIHKIKDSNLSNAISTFNKDWNLASKL